MLEFLRIVQNEWIKLYRRRRFLVVLLLSIALLGVFVFAESRNFQAQKRFADPAFQIQMMEQSIQHTKSMLNDPNIPAEHKADIEKGLAEQEERLNQLKSNPPSAAKFDETSAKAQIEKLKKSIESLPPDQAYQKGDMELNLMMAEYRLQNKLFDPMNSEMPYFQEDGWSAIKDFMTIAPQVFIPLLAVLLVSDIVSGEQTGGTIKLLLTRPASRGKILFGKYITAISATVFVNLVFFSLLVGVSLVMFGSDFHLNPVATGVKYSFIQQMMEGQLQDIMVVDPANASIISMQTYVLTGILLTLLASVAMATLGFFCSVLVRSAAVSTGLSMGIVIIGVILFNVGRGEKWLNVFLTTHFNLPLAWTGQLSTQLAVPISLPQSLLVLSIWTVAMYGIGYILFRKRDILA